ncbi:MAG TPA: hypothetical protein VGA75_14090, partial [Paracoccaceae bacterium]
MSIIVAYAFIFVAVLLVADAVLRRLFGSMRSAKEVNARLERLQQGTDQLATYSGILSDRGIGSYEHRWFTGAWLQQKYRQTGLQLTFRRRLTYGLLIFLFCWLLSTWLVDQPVLQFLIAVVLAAAAIVMLILRTRT